MSEVSPERLLKRIDDLEQQLNLIIAQGTPNLRERVAHLEGQISALLDPERGVYTKINEMGGKLRGWAIALLTSFTLLLIVAIINLALRG